MNLLNSRFGRRLLFAALYFSEGAPIGYVWWALPSKLAAANVDVETITRISALLALPWALKFLWAPLVDKWQSRRWGLRSWIVAAQILMGAALSPFWFISLTQSLTVTTWLLFIHAVMAATQDVSVDALAIRTVPQSERGSINGWMQAGMLVGRAGLGGGALYLERWLTESAIIGVLLASIWTSTVLLLLSRPHSTADDGSPSRSQFWSAMRQAFSSRRTWWGLAFAASSGAAFEAVGALRGPLLSDRGIPRDTEGLFLAIPVVSAMALGAVVGGTLADRWNRLSAVKAMLVTLCILIGLVAINCSSEPTPFNRQLLLIELGAVYLLVGGFVAASYSLFMELTEPVVGATQFSTFMAATNLCEMWAALVGGQLSAAWGYSGAFGVMIGISLASMAFLLPLKRSN